MPKRNESYFDQMRQKILDAAFTVCMKKPMFEVSMRDVISESGLSQGGIYRYFSSLDEILIELFNRESVNHEFQTRVDSAIISEQIPEKVIGKLFGIWENAILDSLVGVGKIYHEICVLYINDQERLKHFITKTRFSSDEKYIEEKSFSFISQKIAEGYFKPKLSTHDLINFLTTSFDGIIRDLIIVRYYPMDDFPLLEKGRLVKTLCTAFVLLLGGNEELLY